MDNIEAVSVSEHDALRGAVSHVYALRLYHEGVVGPALKALDDEITRLEASSDPVDIFVRSDYADLYHETVAGFLLTVQSTFERGLRSMLAHWPTRKSDPAHKLKTQKAPWSLTQSPNLQDIFNSLVGLRLQLFDSYSDLELLQLIGNSLRHGDGPSAERLHEICPQLWPHWVAPGSVLQLEGTSMVVPSSAPSHPSLDRITLPQALLEQMILSVTWFWEDINFIRCNSFSNSAPPIERSQREHLKSMKQRSSMRVWPT